MALVNWEDWLVWNRGAENPITYEHTVIDIGVIISFTPFVTVTGDGTPTIYESHSDDGVSYTSFALAGVIVSGRYVKIRVLMSDATKATIENVYIIIDAAVLIEDQSDIDMADLVDGGEGAGDRRIALAKSFSLITSVNVILQGVVPGYTWAVIDKSVVSGPRFKVWNNSDVLTDVSSIDIVVRGIAS